ncbi:RAI1-domain-containing protein [Marasmius fiardii PR-910]|nr:RAI1-domain-containing protein [Marasmius fiardii PR-910]
MSKRPLEQETVDSDSLRSPERKKPRLYDGNGHPSLPPKPQINESEGDSLQLEETGTVLSYPPLNQPLKAPPFQLPTPLISFSYDEDHVQEFTDSALRYYKPIPSDALGGRGPNGQSNRNGRRDHVNRVEHGNGVDLNYGYDRWVRRPEERGRLDPLLKAVERVCYRDGSGENQEGKLRLKDISIVAWRGVITKILTAPYEERDGWSMNVMVIDGTLHLEEHLDKGKLLEKNNIEDRQHRNMYYGYAFESFCTTDSPVDSSSRDSVSSSYDQEPSFASDGRDDTNSLWGGDVNTNVQWCSVVKTKLGDMRIIIGGEVDCVKGPYHPRRTDNFVELKTSMTIRKWNQGDELRFDKKLLKFYFQSFLLGVPEIIVGFRTAKGYLTSVESFKTIEIPRMVRGKPGGWEPSVCLGWGYRFLRKLLDTCTEGKLWRVDFIPGSGARVRELSGDEMAEVINGEERVGFLPVWYVNANKL